MTECFVLAAMSQKEVDRQEHTCIYPTFNVYILPSSSLCTSRHNGTMLVFSAVFLCASLLLTNTFGSVGFILANCINLAARVIHSCHFILNYFSTTPYRPLMAALPSFPMVMAFVLSFLITACSEVSALQCHYLSVLTCFIPLSGHCVVIREFSGWLFTS